MKDLIQESEAESVAAAQVEPTWPAFMRQGLEPLETLRSQIEDLQESLADIQAIGGTQVAKKTQRMMHELDAFAPAITFIGQVKSGKTTLVNTMSGRPGLLPADVNPWTSVVTSMHLGHPRSKDAPVATFSFFDAEEWDHLVKNGGRIGELSERTGAEKEAERLRVQIAEMREKTKERLGRKFELLLGQTHSYQTMANDLIQRYVCLGDDFETASSRERKGQFADITRSAELYLSAPHLPVALTLRDTPGMNDTFMMREQITIRSIRDSKICCVVLSAHQALNAVDMGIIRMISSVKSRQVVIFVNRVDELSCPHEQIPEIHASLLKTLTNRDDPEGPQIIFGSAIWGDAAQRDCIADLPPDSIAALEDYGSYATVPGIEDMDERGAVWALSGVPALYTALGERIAEGAGRKAISSVRRRATNIVSGLRASSSIVTIKATSDTIRNMEDTEIELLMSRIASDATERLNASLNTVFSSFGERVDQAHYRFVERAIDALLQHFENNGDDQVWSYSADGLRMLMRTAYQVMRSRFNKQCTKALEATAADLTEAYGRIFNVAPENFSVETPTLPDLPQPVTIAQMIILDVKTSWWKSWWGQRKGWRAHSDGFRELIEAETLPMVQDLKVTQLEDIRALAHENLNEFLSEQRSVLSDICDKAQIKTEDLHGLFGVTSQEEREELFDIIFEELDIDLDEDAGDDA
ncbi:dynamin family protein [uncultured Tateyamaria sp.]|uniref:dynamin family protein n=1 Tax=uncultured Tateyamaria sp. TaxID=455651 RepID=UPI002608BEFF|nr:dynamin family protein [uncultured Tateyamaria sp.]